MIDVVLDTNILVSALWSKDSNPDKIAHLIPDGKIIPCFCEEILSEYKLVLSRPAFCFTAVKVDELLMNLVKHGKTVVAYRSCIPLPDEDDRVFYDTAKESGAILITGNTKHYPTEPFIMTPAGFLSAYENELCLKKV